MGALRDTPVSALTAQADNDLLECEALLKRAIEMVRGPARRSPTRALPGSRPTRVVHIHHDPYDAAYIALAEATNSVLCTCDDKLRNGHRARVVLFTRCRQ